jgi:predicted DNA-binding transcriptional regulator AlpA
MMMKYHNSPASSTAQIETQSQQTHSPEFIDYKEMRSLFGISRALAYRLTEQGLIKSVTLRKPGAIRGKRLWVVDSVRDYLLRCIDQRSIKSLAH